MRQVRPTAAMLPHHEHLQPPGPALTDTAILHATAVCLGERGVLVRGAPGTGKSTLALMLLRAWIAAGAHAALVADDQTMLTAAHGALIARPHPCLAGVMERRGLGFIAPPSIPACRLALVVDLVLANHAPRLPEPDNRIALCGVCLPCLALPASEPSVAALIVGEALAFDGTRTHLVSAPGPPAAPADAVG